MPIDITENHMAKQQEATQKTLAADAPQPDQPVAATPAVKPRGIPKRVMYIGPTIVENGRVFTHGQIFSNGLPDYWMEKAAAEPEFRQLLVAVDRVGKSLADMRDTNSMLAQAGRKILADSRRRIRKAREGKK